MAPKSIEKSCFRYANIWSKLNDKKPEQVAINSHTKFLFDCNDCTHSYDQSPDSKTAGKGCPYCANSKLCSSMECEFCLNKSCFRHNSIWSKLNDKSPEQIAISSNNIFWFDCHTCHHSYKQRPDSKTKGDGCPYCSNQKLCGSIECDFCLKKSCHIYTSIWSDKNDKSPEHVAISSNKFFI